MRTLNRRRFIARAAGATGLGLGLPAVVGAQEAASQRSAEAAERTVRLSGDGLGLTPLQYSRLLARLVEVRVSGKKTASPSQRSGRWASSGVGTAL